MVEGPRTQTTAHTGRESAMRDEMNESQYLLFFTSLLLYLISRFLHLFFSLSSGRCAAADSPKSKATSLRCRAQFNKFMIVRAHTHDDSGAPMMSSNLTTSLSSFGATTCWAVECLHRRRNGTRERRGTRSRVALSSDQLERAKQIYVVWWWEQSTHFQSQSTRLCVFFFAFFYNLSKSLSDNDRNLFLPSTT